MLKFIFSFINYCSFFLLWPHLSNWSTYYHWDELSQIFLLRLEKMKCYYFILLKINWSRLKFWLKLYLNRLCYPILSFSCFLNDFLFCILPFPINLYTFVHDILLNLNAIFQKLLAIIFNILYNILISSQILKWQ